MSPVHLLLILSICVLWAFNFIAAAWAVEHFPPILFTVLRFIIVGLLMLPFVRKPAPGQWGLLVLVCLSIGALHFAFAFTALAMADDISSVAIVMQIYIPMTTLLAVWLLKETIGWRSVAGILTAFGGVLAVGFDPIVLDQLEALGLVLLAAFFLALGTTLMRRIDAMNPFTFQAWNALLSLPILLVLTLWLESDQITAMQSAGWSQWAAIVYSAVAASIVAHGIFFWLIQRYPVTEVTPYLLVSPILAVGMGVWIWGDDPTWRLYMGGVLVLSGVLIVSLRAKARQKPVPQPDRAAPAA